MPPPQSRPSSSPGRPAAARGPIRRPTGASCPTNACWRRARSTRPPAPRPQPGAGRARGGVGGDVMRRSWRPWRRPTIVCQQWVEMVTDLLGGRAAAGTPGRRRAPPGRLPPLSGVPGSDAPHHCCGHSPRRRGRARRRRRRPVPGLRRVPPWRPIRLSSDPQARTPAKTLAAVHALPPAAESRPTVYSTRTDVSRATAAE